MDIDRDLPFRGARDYLYSSTLFDDLLSLQDGNPANIDFTFHKKSDRQVHYQSAPPKDQFSVVATWKDTTQTVYIVERDDLMSKRIAYDEASLISCLEFGPDGVVVPVDIAGFTVTEAVVAGFKALLHRDVAVHKPKVVCVRIRFRSMPTLPLTVRYGRRIGGFYQGQVICNDVPVGQIFFGEWQ